MPTFATKLLALLVLPVLLAACGGAKQPAAEAAPTAEATATDAMPTEDTAATEPATDTAAAGEMTESDFVAISAEIVCLIQNNANADPKALEAKAQQIVASHGSSEAAYDAYQAGMSEEVRKSLSLAVIGKAGELCSFGSNGAAATEAAPTAPAATPLSTAPAATSAASTAPAAPLRLGN